MYQITNYTKEQAKKLGVEVKPSTNPKKKIDVFKNGSKVASVGATGYNDFPTFQEKCGKEFAEDKRRLYKLRHARDRNVPNTPGYYADKLLW